MTQEDVRKLCRIAKALNEDIYYVDFAEYLDISAHGFYNWLNGYYNLNNDKLWKLYDVIVDLAKDD